MPLVKRTIEIVNTITQSKGTAEHIVYVAPGKQRRGDIVIEPTNRQLAELAHEHPEEFGELAKKRNVEPGVLTGSDPRLRAFMAKSAKDLVKEIENLDPDEDADAVLLAEIFESETGDEGSNRATVIRALATQGFEAEASDEK